MANLSLGFCETGYVVVVVVFIYLFISSHECMHATYSFQEDTPYSELWV
jgi:hypothetical protein